VPDEKTPEVEIESEEEGAATATQAPPRPTPTRRKPKQLPPYKVLLHNDDANTIEHVILAIVKLTALSTKDAVRRTLEAHETGVSLLLVTHQERAELYREQFASLSLTVTIEPDAA